MNEYYKIEDICKVKGGKRIPQGETLQLEQNEHPYIRILDMYQGRVINLNNEMQYAKDSYWNQISSYIVNTGDVILAIVGNTLGMVSIIGETLNNANLTENCCKFVDLDEKKVLPMFLYYSLKSPLNQKQIDVFRVGSSQPKLPIYNINQLVVPKYSIEVQQKIINILADIDSKIENNNKINAELESMAKTIYDYWFLQFEFPNEEGKPYKSSGGKMVWNEELKREIPEGWEVVQIGKILDKYPKTESVLRDDYEKGILFPIIDQSKYFICGYTDDKDKVLYLKDAIVFGDHTNFAKYINFDFARGADGTQIVVSKNKNLPNYLLYLQIISLPVIEQGYSRHFKFLKEQFVFVPNTIVSEKYMKIIEDALLLIKKNIFENRELSLLRDFLLPMLMNGQIGFK